MTFLLAVLLHPSHVGDTCLTFSLSIFLSLVKRLGPKRFERATFL
jgi:hypothetical protein